MCAAVLRLKRKASSEPIEGLVIALKKSKECDLPDSNEVYFKFAATVKSENDSIKEHIQAVLSKEKESKFVKWRNPKGAALKQRNVSNICEKLRNECKAASEKKKLDYLNNRRLIFTESVPIDDDKESPLQTAKLSELFQLYDIIEENEEPKKQAIEKGNSITCNGIPLIREKVSEFVYDVYVTDGQLDKSFVDNAVSLRPCTDTTEDLYFGGDSDDEIYEDEDDSNDESNWRNEYPEDEKSGPEEAESEEEYDEDLYYGEIQRSFNHIELGDDCDYDENPFHHSEILREVEDDYSNDYSD